MGKRFTFTAESVARHSCPPDKQQELFWDSETPGLGLRTTRGGAKAYIFEGWLNGGGLRVTIGNPSVWPLETQRRRDPLTGEKVEVQRGARAEARRLKALIDRGIDPRVERSEQRAKAEADRAEAVGRLTTIEEAWADYLNQNKRHWGARHYADHLNLSQIGGQSKKRGTGLTVPGVLRTLMPLRLPEVTATVLSQWQTEQAPHRANNARQGFELFRAFWRWCASHPPYKFNIDASAVENADLRRSVPARKSKRFDVLERTHLPAWFASIRALENPVISAYLQALLLTGARREELAALRWTDVDLQWNALWLKDKVAPEGRKIPLTPYLRSLLLELKLLNETQSRISRMGSGRTSPGANRYSENVFFSRSAANGRIVEPRIAHNRALATAGVPHVTLHGLRRSFASLAEWVEIPKGVVAQIMGHAPNATAEKHYISRPLELLALWHKKYELWILEQAGVPIDSTNAPERLRLVTTSRQAQ